MSFLCDTGKPRRGTFFRELFGVPMGIGGQCIELRQIGAAGKSGFYSDIDSFMSALDPDLQPKGSAWYFGVHPRDRQRGTSEDVSLVTSLHADLDFKKQSYDFLVASLKAFRYPVTAAVMTGNGLHGYWFLKEPEPIEGPEGRIRFESIQAGLQAHLGADKTHDLARILRIPGSLNYKTTPPKQSEILFAIGRQENNSSPDVQGQDVPFSLPEPWPDPVDGATLLHELKSFIGRYVILPAGALVAVALWIICTWLVEVFSTSAYLVVQSQTRECGKTRLLEVLDLTVRKPFFSVAATEAALFRILDSQQPTLIIDEAEALAGRSERADAVRSIINAAHRRGPGVPRCIGEDNEVRFFKVFGFIAIAGIGRTWDTIEGRSISIEMERKSPSDSVARFRRRKVEIEAENLRRRIMRWSADNAEAVAEAQPALPDFLGDREQDVWEPLMCVAHTLGPDVAESLTESAKALLRADDEDNAPQIQIIRDLKIIFGDRDKLLSETICEELEKMERRKWPEYRNGKPITQNQLARLLKGFNRPDGLPIGPTDVRLETVKKGYHRSWFERLFSIYAKTPPSKALQALQPSNDAASSGFQSATPNRACSASETPSNPRQDCVVALVALPRGVPAEKQKNESLGRSTDAGFQLGSRRTAG